MKHNASLLIILCCVLLLCGCGKDEQLENYKNNMEVFFSNVEKLNDKINSIDSNSDNAVDELLSNLDLLTESIEQMASLEVPKQFEGVEQLADEALDNMQQANALFHEAYANDEYRSNVGDAALQYYERVNVRLHYIVSILHGEIPE